MSERIILITGTRKGIGEVLAKYYLSLGDIVIGCSRSVPDWYDEKSFPSYTHFIADVSSEEDAGKIFSFIRKKYGHLDILINNAGTASMNHTLLTPMTTVQKVIDTNLVGTFLFCREGAKLMRKSQHGRIINFSTAAVALKLPGEAIYTATKAAIVSLTEVLAREFSDYKITVNALGPVLLKTDLIRGVPQEKLDKVVASQAIHRYATYEDIENVIDFFIRPESDFITGQVLYLGGL